MNDKYRERKRRRGTASKDEKYFNHNRSRAFHTKNQFHMSQGLSILISDLNIFSMFVAGKVSYQSSEYEI